MSEAESADSSVASPVTLSIRGASGAPIAMRVPEPGDVLAGKYRVERILGGGGMGVVLEVVHLTLGDTRALKLLRARDENGTWAARLLREAQLATRLRSEHVARVHDTGLLEDGTPYVVMERLHGETCASLLERRGRLPVGETISLVLAACDALAEAHAKGLVHRDVKPSNLFLAKLDAEHAPTLKLLDFGLAKELDARSNLTASEGVLGSPAYMSPEQIRAARDVDVRTDIWALGVVLHELLTASLPFSARTAAGTLASIIADEPASLHHARPEVPSSLVKIVRRCLAKNPDARFSSVEELVRALRTVSTSSEPARFRIPAWALVAGAAITIGIVSAASLRASRSNAEPVNASSSSAPDSSATTTSPTLAQAPTSSASSPTFFAPSAAPLPHALPRVIDASPKRAAKSTTSSAPAPSVSSSSEIERATQDRK